MAGIIMRFALIALTLTVFLLPFQSSAANFDTVAKDRADKMGCLSCHEGIEQFTDGPMMETIIDMG